MRRTYETVGGGGGVEVGGGGGGEGLSLERNQVEEIEVRIVFGSLSCHELLAPCPH